MTEQITADQDSTDMPPSALDGSYLEEHIPYEVTLEGGVREALSRFAPHMKHIKKGTVMCDGRKRLLCIDLNKVIERATLISVADRVIVKYGRHVTIGQVNAMRFVRKHTTVPVPEVLGYHEDERGYKYVVVSYIKGSDLCEVWDLLTVGQRENLAEQLRVIFDELHSVKGSYIGGIGRLPPEGPLFRWAEKEGPYEKEGDMNEAILRRKHGRWKEYGGYPPDSFVNCTLPGLPTNHDIVLSHGQMEQEHIIVDVETESVTGIVGWSQSGFFPEYWDFVHAMRSTSWGWDWIKCIPSSLKPYCDEYPLWYQIGKLVA